LICGQRSAFPTYQHDKQITIIINDMRKESPATPTLNSTVKNGTIVNYYQDDTFSVNLFQDNSLKSVNLFQDVSALRYGGFAYPPGILKAVSG
jgi:hypothetical protein